MASENEFEPIGFFLVAQSSQKVHFKGGGVGSDLVGGSM